MASVSPGSAQATPSGAATAATGPWLWTMRLDEAELLVERQAVVGGDEPPLPGVAVHQPLQHRAGEAAAAPVAGDDDHVEGAGRPERRRQGGADHPVAVEGGDAAAEAEDQRPVLRPVRPALGAGERDGAVEMGGVSASKGLGRLGHRHPGWRHSGGGRRAGAVPLGPAAQSCAVLAATHRRKCRGAPRPSGRREAEEAAARNKLPRARAIRRFLLHRRASAGPSGGGTVQPL